MTRANVMLDILEPGINELAVGGYPMAYVFEQMFGRYDRGEVGVI